MLLSKNLTPIKAEACRRIDAAAEAFRLTQITPGEGQALEYNQSRVEALRVLDTISDPINESEVPHIAKEAQRRGVTLIDEANLVISMATAWSLASAELKTARLGAKDAVNAATTPAQVEAIVNAFIEGITSTP